MSATVLVAFQGLIYIDYLAKRKTFTGIYYAELTRKIAQIRLRTAATSTRLIFALDPVFPNCNSIWYQSVFILIILQNKGIVEYRQR